MTQVPSRAYKQSTAKKKHSMSIHFGIPNITSSLLSFNKSYEAPLKKQENVYSKNPNAEYLKTTKFQKNHSKTGRKSNILSASYVNSYG